MTQSPIPLNETRRDHYASLLTRLLMAVSVPAAGLFAFAGYTYSLPQLYIPSAAILARVIFDFVPLSLIRHRRTGLAMMLVMASFIVNGLIASFVVQGLGLIIALAIGLVVFASVILAMPSKYTNVGLFFGIAFGLMVLALDSLLGIERVQIPAVQRVIPYILAGMSVPYSILLVREFRRFSLQTKVTLGIMATGGVAVGLISFFAVSQSAQLAGLISGRLEANVRLNAEEQLTNRTREEARLANQFFEEIAHRVDDLAAYRAALQKRQATLELGSYWNASESLSQLEGGQYGNSPLDDSSVFIPVTVPLDEAALRELNTSAYLDFFAPEELEENPSILAIYAIDRRGVIRYYPNIELASLLPPDFDATKRPYYEITSPQFNPEREERWAIPYVDAAGGGLVVTVAVPVYYGNVFNGIIAADLQLSVITEQISSVKVGETGYAFVIDDAGRPIYMPPAGYDMFGVDPATLNDEDYSQFSILGKGPEDLQGFTDRMTTGGSGLGILQVNGMEAYISFAPLESTGYSLALVAPTTEMQTAIFATRQETEEQVRSAVQTGITILAAAFIGALLISVALGSLIASPIRNLTETANRIVGGDLTARANVISADETGLLAETFNAMTQQLGETLSGLEARVRERTAESEQISRVNAYRASRLEIIARISRAIGATQSLETLLPQIAETISRELGYYHTGIFLLDAQKEYAILVATNSEGGKQMLARNHRLPVEKSSIVGFVASLGEPRIALDVGQDATYFDNLDLPDTHSEAALPLRVGNEIIGILDVQSMEINAFSQEEVNILSILADQVSIAIQNARSYQQSLEALDRAKKTADQLSEQQWFQFVQRQPLTGYHFDGVNTRPAQLGSDHRPNSMAIPIMLRGVKIGTLRLSAPNPDRAWDESEIAMAQAAAERTAIAIETARLLDDAQKQATKERTIGQISARIGSLVNIENILQTAIQELGATLPDADVVIQFAEANADAPQKTGARNAE